MTSRDARVERADIEAKLRQIRGTVEGGAEAARTSLLGSAAGAGVVLVLLAYWFGRRRGRLRSTVVEVRRV